MTQSIAYQFWLKLPESYVLRSILGTLVSCFHDHIIAEIRLGLTVRDKCLYLEFFWSVFSRIWTEYEEILHISPYSVGTRENIDQKNSEYGLFSYCSI